LKKKNNKRVRRLKKTSLWFKLRQIVSMLRSWKPTNPFSFITRLKRSQNLNFSTGLPEFSKVLSKCAFSMLKT
jgi:hypothetical protein